MAFRQSWEPFGVRGSILIILGTCALAANSSNTGYGGREFVFTPVPNDMRVNPSVSIGMILQAVADGDVHVNIFLVEISLQANINLLTGSGPYDFPLPQSLLYSSISGKINSTVVVTSDKDIFVLAYNIRNYTSDIISVVPKHYLGQEYFVATISTPGAGTRSLGSIISISSLEQNSVQNTYIEIFPHSLVIFENELFYPGDVIRYTLQPYETIQFLPPLTNITGSRILANAPIAVSAGTKCTRVPVGVDSCDHVADQLAPFTAWGKVYVISPLPARLSGHYLQIVAGRDNTTVSYEGMVVQLDMGDYETVDISDQKMLDISADKPISVIQYSPGYERDHPGDPSSPGYDRDYTGGDPSMVRAIPVEQYVTQAKVPVYEFPPAITMVRNTYLGITSRCEYMENINVLKDDIAVTPKWIDMHNSTVDALNGTRFCGRWTQVYNGTYTLRSQPMMTEDGQEIYPRFSALVYGAGYRESYFYRAAFDDRTLTCVDYRPTLDNVDPDKDCEVVLIASGVSIPPNICSYITGLQIYLAAALSVLFGWRNA